MAGTFLDRVQTFFQVVHFGVELTVDALGLGVQLVLLFDFVLQLNDGWDTAFA